MSWQSNDGRHEGYVLSEFLDGVRSRATSGGGVPDDQVIVDVEYVGQAGAITDIKYTTRPAAEVVGWRVACDCLDDYGGTVPEKWVSDLLVRVPSKALEDPSRGRIYAPDDEVIDIDETHRDAMNTIWRREHADKLDALGAVREARARERLAQDDLTAAAVAARAAGATWEAIGQAAGISRQGAQDRWGTRH